MECRDCQGMPAHEESPTTSLISRQACPACGCPVDPATALSEDKLASETRIVESSADGQELRVSYMPARVESTESRELVPAKPQNPALARLAQLPALAWRQPVVRSAVKTGASAVVLTVALRVAGRVLASSGAREMTRDSLLPTLADLMSPTESDARPLRPQRRARRSRRACGEQVSEVFIYMRRTVGG